MSVKKTDSISYLYKEMDPSEQVEFERMLSKNENLLIEVESLRNISKKLDKLPEISAPDHLLKSISRQAGQNGSASGSFRKRTYYFATAALLTIGFMAGALIYESEDGSGNSGSASIGSAGFGESEQSKSAISIESNRDVSTWVDRNDILHFSGLDSDRPDSLLQNSYQRLTPVKNTSQNNQIQRELHLTGSRQ